MGIGAGSAHIVTGKQHDRECGVVGMVLEFLQYGATAVRLFVQNDYVTPGSSLKYANRFVKDGPGVPMDNENRSIGIFSIKS